MRITKIKNDVEGLTLEWTEEREEMTIPCGPVSRDHLPHPDFLGPWKALKPLFMKLLGLLPDGLTEEDQDAYLEVWELRSVGFKYGGETTQVGCTLISLIETHNSPLVTNFYPGWKFNDTSDADAESALPALMRRNIRTVRAEAKEYLDGKSAQGELFDKGTKAGTDG